MFVGVTVYSILKLTNGQCGIYVLLTVRKLIDWRGYIVIHGENKTSSHMGDASVRVYWNIDQWSFKDGSFSDNLNLLY